MEEGMEIESKIKIMSKNESGLREERCHSPSTLHHFNLFNLPNKKGAAVETAAPC